MVSYIFQDLLAKGKAEGIDDSIRQKDTRAWFRDAAKKIQTVNNAKMLNDKDNTSTFITMQDTGKMFMFFYDPKHKKTLPYYDTFPLIFPLEFYDDGFLGINLHYLPPVLRAKLMDALYNTINNKKYDKTTVLNISYKILSQAARYKYFKPCLKRYLREHVRSKFLNVEPRLWDAALMLPTARFQKETKENVWNFSQGMV